MSVRNDPDMMIKLYERCLIEKADYLSHYGDLKAKKKCLLAYFNQDAQGVRDDCDSLTLDEFRAALKRMNIVGEAVEELFKRYDIDGSNVLSPNEFVNGVFREYHDTDLGKSVLEYMDDDETKAEEIYESHRLRAKAT